jgi:hypothetical protein
VIKNEGSFDSIVKREETRAFVYVDGSRFQRKIFSFIHRRERMKRKEREDLNKRQHQGSHQTLSETYIHVKREQEKKGHSVITKTLLFIRIAYPEVNVSSHRTIWQWFSTVSLSLSFYLSGWNQNENESDSLSEKKSQKWDPLPLEREVDSIPRLRLTQERKESFQRRKHRLEKTVGMNLGDEFEMREDSHSPCIWMLSFPHHYHLWSELFRSWLQTFPLVSFRRKETFLSPWFSPFLFICLCSRGIKVIDCVPWPEHSSVFSLRVWKAEERNSKNKRKLHRSLEELVEESEDKSPKTRITHRDHKEREEVLSSTSWDENCSVNFPSYFSRVLILVMDSFKVWYCFLPWLIIFRWQFPLDFEYFWIGTWVSRVMCPECSSDV